MFRGIQITPPFFEIGPKAYLYGEECLKLARFADRMSVKYGVQIIFTPQYVDIPLLARATRNLLVFAQHMDSLPVGRGVGSVLPEAVRAAGATGEDLRRVYEILCYVRQDGLHRQVHQGVG